MCAHCKAEKSWCGVSVSRLANKRKKMCTQGNIIIIMHSHAVKDKGETSVCTVQRKEELGAV